MHLTLVVPYHLGAKTCGVYLMSFKVFLWPVDGVYGVGYTLCATQMVYMYAYNLVTI